MSWTLMLQIVILWIVFVVGVAWLLDEHYHSKAND
jgi:hypothetical protein